MRPGWSGGCCGHRHLGRAASLRGRGRRSRSGRPHERGRWPTWRRRQPTAAVGVSRRCLRALIKTTSGEQGATGLLCRSAGRPPPDRPRRELRQTDRWPSRPSAPQSYLPGHQAGILRHHTKHGDRSRRLRCGPGRAGLRQHGREGHRGPAHLTWAAPLPTWVGARSGSAGTCGSGYTRPKRVHHNQDEQNHGQQDPQRAQGVPARVL